MKKISDMYYFQLLLDIVSVLLLLVYFTIHLITNFAKIPGFQFSSFVVQSGSMEPTINTGDMVLIKEKVTYELNDVVTFLDASKRVVTHRIVDQDESDLVFTTKGDANRTRDNDHIKPNQILGQVFLVLPRLGFLAVFARSFWGVTIFITIPALTIILRELFKHGSNSKKNSSLA